MKVIGLTGSIFSGKSTVAKVFRSKGAAVIDADKIAHKKFKELEPRLSKLFGKNFNRKSVARVVFSDKKKLKQLCKILHPAIITEIKQKIKQLKVQGKAKMIIVDAPLLIESGLHKSMDKIIVVSSPKKEIIKRGLKEGISKSDVLSRLKRQLKQSEKIKYADFIIQNNKHKKYLTMKAIELYCLISKLKRGVK